MKKINGIVKEDMDMKIRAQDDFYHFACGGWLKNNPIPKTESKWGSFYILRDENRKRIKKIFKELKKEKNLKKGSTGQLIRDFYNSGMDEKRIEHLGLTPLAPELEMIKTDSFQDTLTHFHTIGMSLLWGSYVSLDEKNSSKMSLYVSQGSLGLPEREYYLSEEEKFVAIRTKYIKHVRKMLEFSGIPKKELKYATERIMDIETKLAKASMSKEERRDREKAYNKMSLKELQTVVPLINWKRYFASRTIDKPKTIIVEQVKYMKSLNTLLKSVSHVDWQYYLQYRLISNVASLLPQEIAKEQFKFYGKVLGGLKEMKPRWQQVYGVLDDVLSDALGEEYTARYFSDNAKAIMNDLIKDLLAAFKERIQNVDWMSKDTKKKALLKLSTFVSKIGYPKKKHVYKGLTITPHEYLRNSLKTIQFESAKEFAKLCLPIDRDEWFMGAHEVNAYYWSNQNEIVFPAGILQPPFFDEKGDVAINYGAIGAVIGHELTHGFDDEGSKFDHKGNLKDWWTTEDRKAFMKKTKLIEKQYNKFVAVDELFVNGKLTLGENIADLGGVILGYYALQKHMEHNGRLPDSNGYTPEQRFFFGTALVERAHSRKETSRFMAICDPHSPSYTRVNGPLSHVEAFYEAFDVKKGDAMYRKESERADIW